MDEFLVSGETIIRNLELGWARAEALGRAMPVGYLPDMFGHIAQMPQILRRAGIERAVVWRGVPAAIDRNAFPWAPRTAPRSRPSTSSAATATAPTSSTSRTGSAPSSLAIARPNAAFYGERSVLAMYGTDHAVPSPRLADLVDAANGATAGSKSGSRRWPTTPSRPRAVDERPSPRWTGELRSGARANMLMGVTLGAHRPRGRRRAGGAPARALCRAACRPARGAWPERLLELAWRRVVDNSAHDSICGCSHDAVVAQVLTRFAEAEQIGRGIVGEVTNGSRRGTCSAAGRSSTHRRSTRIDLVTLTVPVAWEPSRSRGGRPSPSRRCRVGIGRSPDPSSEATSSPSSSNADDTVASCSGGS